MSDVRLDNLTASQASAFSGVVSLKTTESVEALLGPAARFTISSQCLNGATLE